MIRFLRRGAADQKGAAAIEFVLIFPVLFVLHLGAAEALMAYQAQRNVAHIASAMADIVAQSRSVTTSDLDDVLAVSVSMIHPFPNANLQQRITSIYKNDSGTTITDWSVNKAYTASGSASVPTGYLANGESVIVTDVIYDYKPTFGMFLPATVRFTRHAYVRPRLSQKVEKVAS
jgi:Flp pilus assembly protein TadG